jgi:DNA-binding transcriptional LysR family regulator
MTERPLDLDAVQAFIRIAELGSFTHAAEAMRTTQAAVSLKLKRLEARFGCRLIERTPRYVQLSAQGAAFLEHARELLAVHDKALAVFAGARQRLTICGIRGKAATDSVVRRPPIPIESGHPIRTKAATLLIG